MFRTKVGSRLRVPPGVPGNERINAFSDGVFAIVITLLVLELHVPDVPDAQLMHALRDLLPKIVGHVVSFVVLGIYWVGHFNMFLHITRHDRVLLWLNVLFLLCVATMPFPTGLLIRYSEQPIAIVVYAGTLAVAGIVLDLMWWYATHNHRLVQEHIAPELVAFVHRRVLLAPAMYLLAIIVSFFSVTASKVLVAIVAIFYIVPHPLDHYHQAQLVQVNQHE